LLCRLNLGHHLTVREGIGKASGDRRVSSIWRQNATRIDIISRDNGVPCDRALVQCLKYVHIHRQLRTANRGQNVINGSCLCGEVSYEITGDVGEIVHCHCVTCRKAHGAAFSSVAAVQDENFKLNGAKKLTSFESSKGKYRYFCNGCGTQIYAKRDNTQHIILRLGSLDGNPMTQEKAHIWLSEKAQWYSINNKLPEFQEAE